MYVYGGTRFRSRCWKAGFGPPMAAAMHHHWRRHGGGTQRQQRHNTSETVSPRHRQGFGRYHLVPICIQSSLLHAWSPPFTWELFHREEQLLSPAQSLATTCLCLHTRTVLVAASTRRLAFLPYASHCRQFYIPCFYTSIYYTVLAFICQPTYISTYIADYIYTSAAGNLRVRWTNGSRQRAQFLKTGESLRVPKGTTFSSRLLWLWIHNGIQKAGWSRILL